MIDRNDFPIPRLTLVGGFFGAGKTTLLQRLTTHLGKDTLLINLRAEAEPAVLEKIVQKAVDAAKGVSIVWREKAAFRPGQPTPTHRVAAV